MSETVTIARAEYERLCALEEDFEDLHATSVIEARIAAGATNWCLRAWPTGLSTVNPRFAFGGSIANFRNPPWRAPPA